MDKFKHIVFGPELVLGIGVVDDQHKRIVHYYNNMVNSFNNGLPGMTQILDELINYTLFHFYNEEKFLETINYPEFAGHKKKHASLLDELKALAAELRLNDSKEIKEKILSISRDCIVFHIMIEDRMYVDYYNQLSRTRSAQS
jgi:hemerythrin-like metal-binding protein